MDLNATATSYTNPIVFLFMSAFMLTLALEKHNLHIRLALYFVRFFGTSANRIVLGFMLSTAFCSMWVSNAAAVLLMLPIASSVLNLLKDGFGAGGPKEDYAKFATSLLLGLAYGASVGGISTLIGTPVNIVLATTLKEYYNIDLTFLAWLYVGLPVVLVMLALAYGVIVKVLFRVQAQPIANAPELIEEKIRALGPMSYQQYAVSAVFITTASLWVLRTYIATTLDIAYLSDPIIGVAGAISLFLLPDSQSKGGFLCEWKDMEKLSWGILLLIGGGLAVAKAMEKTGLVSLIGQIVVESGSENTWHIVAVLTGLTLLLTQFVGNTALNSIALPISFGIAENLQIDPMLVGIPVSLAASFSFLLPISTPANAIVFTSGHVKMKDMIAAGLIMVCLGLGIIMLAIVVYQRVSG